MRIFDPCPPCGRQGRPGEGTWQARIHLSRGGSAPRERDHRGGDHPVPSRTRQLSPPSPRVLQREAAGGQGVALAEGAFLHARARRMRRERPAGDRPLRAFPHLAAIWLDDAGGVSPPEHPARTFLVSAALPGEAPRASHTEEPRGISSAAFFAFLGVERPARG